MTLDSAPAVPTYIPGYVYPTTPLTETAYTIATSYPSGNPGRSIQSTTDVPEGTNLYFTDSRVQTAMSGTVGSLSGRISTVEQTITANLSGSITNTNTDIATLSGRVNTLSGVVDTKISLTSLSATGGISYNSGSGLFSWIGTTDRVVE